MIRADETQPMNVRAIYREAVEELTRGVKHDMRIGWRIGDGDHFKEKPLNLTSKVVTNKDATKKADTEENRAPLVKLYAKRVAQGLPLWDKPEFVPANLDNEPIGEPIGACHTRFDFVGSFFRGGKVLQA